MESKVGKIILAIVTAVILVAVIAIIIMDPGTNKEKVNEDNKNEVSKNVEENSDIDYMSNAEKQFAEPAEGETIAVMHVKGFGKITFKFFDDVAPKAVENFLTHAKDGYYNGVKFHRVMNEFMIQSGDPEGTGAGGESIWGTGFEEEIDESILPYRGSLCMASTGYGMSSLGSQFFITQANPDNEMASMLEAYGYPKGLIDAYKTYGGYMSLAGQYTVFGQVVDGMDVVDKIAGVKVKESDTGEMSVPVEDVIIEKIEVKEYSK